jgi:hypothetical protein
MIHLTHLGLWHRPSRQRAPPYTASPITLDYSVADEPVSYDETRSVNALRAGSPSRRTVASARPPAAGTGPLPVRVGRPPAPAERPLEKRGRPVGPGLPRAPVTITRSPSPQRTTKFFWFIKIFLGFRPRI